MNKTIKILMAGTLVAGMAGMGMAQDRPVVRMSSPNIRDLQLRGRVQAQVGFVDTDNDEGGGSYSTMELRRVRMGMRGTLFQTVRAQLEANLVPGSDLSMRSAFLEWREHKPAYIKLGLDKPVFGFEENTSSASILTVERTLIGNTLVPGAMNGLSLSGGVDMLSYSAGVYTGYANRNEDGEDDYLINVSAGLKLDDMVGDAKLRLRADYINNGDDNAYSGRDDAMAASVHFAIGRFDVRGEYMTASKSDSDISGYYVMPSFFVTDKLQAVLRFEGAESDDAKGLRAPSRYARRVDVLASRSATDDTPAVDPQRGDDYMAAYVGMNYYFAGDNHKLMAGVEVAELDNTDAGKLSMTTAYTAWRMLF